MKTRRKASKVWFHFGLIDSSKAPQLFELLPNKNLKNRQVNFLRFDKSLNLIHEIESTRVEFKH